jgi:hypothetical protein
VDSTGPGKGSEAGTHEHSDEPSGSGATKLVNLLQSTVGAPPPSVSSWPHGQNDSSLPSSTVSLNFYEV